MNRLQYRAPDQQSSARPEPVEGVGLDARQVIIQHVEHLHIHTAGLETPFQPVLGPGA